MDLQLNHPIVMCKEDWLKENVVPSNFYSQMNSVNVN